MELLYCKECQDEIWDYGAPASVLYESVFKHCLKKKKPLVLTAMDIFCIDGKMPLVEFLERKGYLITTEYHKNAIAIWPASKCKHCR